MTRPPPDLDTLATEGLRAPPERALDVFQEAWPALEGLLSKYLAVLRVSTNLREDCGQEALWRVWSNRTKYKGQSRGELLGWIYRITERVHHDLIQREARAPVTGVEPAGLEESEASRSDPAVRARFATAPEGDPTARAAEDADTMRALEACVGELDAKLQRVVDLLYHAPELTEREAARVLGISKTYVNKLKDEALGRVGRCLERKGIA